MRRVPRDATRWRLAWRSGLVALLLSPCALPACRAGELLLVADGDAGGVTTNDARDAGDPDAAAFYDMGVTPPVTCPDYREGPDFALCSASYVGGPSHDRATAVAVLPNGEILLAGLLAELPSVSEVHRLYTAGSGAILRLDATGSRMLSLTRIGQRVNDLSVAPRSGAIAVAADFGVALLDPRAERVEWMQLLQEGASRVDIASDDQVAAISGNDIHLFAPDGAPVGRHWVDAREVHDVAIDPEQGSVYVVGEIAGTGCAEAAPFLRAYDLGGGLRFRAYDDPDAAGLCASSRGVRVVRGPDGYVYYAGHSDGPLSPHLMDPLDAAADADIAIGDAFSSPDGATLGLAFVGRFDAEDGSLVRGQLLVPRDQNRAGRLSIAGLAADADGRVFVSGEAGCCIADRDRLRLAGHPPGPYGGGDPFVAVLSPELDRRLSWVTWTGDNGSASNAVAIAVGRAVGVVAINQGDTESTLLTHRPFIERPPGNGDAFLATWPAP